MGPLQARPLPLHLGQPPHHRGQPAARYLPCALVEARHSRGVHQVAVPLPGMVRVGRAGQAVRFEVVSRTLSGQASVGRYKHTRAALLALPQPLWGYWEQRGAMSTVV